MTKEEIEDINNKIASLETQIRIANNGIRNNEKKYDELRDYLNKDFDLIMKVLDAIQQNTAEVTNLIAALNEQKQAKPQTYQDFRTSKPTQRQTTQTNWRDPNAPWRNEPASQGQLAQLRKHHIPITEGITKGQASDTLNRIFSRDKR